MVRFIEGCASGSWKTIQFPRSKPMLHFSNSFYGVALQLFLLHAVILCRVGGFDSDDREAFLSLREALRVLKGHLADWKGENCSQWIGVTCNFLSGHIIWLNLSAMQLSGPISDKICRSQGRFSMLLEASTC